MSKALFLLPKIFGLKLLKENYDRLGLDKNFNVLDSEDSLTLVKKIMKNIYIYLF